VLPNNIVLLVTIEKFEINPMFDPKLFPIAPLFYCMIFCSNFNSHVYKLKRWAIGSTFVSIFQLGVQRGAFWPVFQKNW